MPSLCILTDNTVQFSKLSFTGQKHVMIIPMTSELNGHRYNHQDYKPVDLPKSATDELSPRLIPPTINEFQKLFTDLAVHYEAIIGIFASQKISAYINNALAAVKNLNGKSDFQIIDSQTTSIGLGYLVQVAAEAVEQKKSANEICRLIRSLIPTIYTIFCTPSLTYLYHAGFIDKAQSIVGEMLKIHPIYSFESGDLTPLEKVRNQRHAINYFQEFVHEFEEIKHIGFIQSAIPNYKSSKLFISNVQESFPDITYSKHILNLSLATIFGPNSFGLIIIEENIEDNGYK